LRRASEAIKTIGGVVIAEQLAPYFDPPPIPSESTGRGVHKTNIVVVDEKWMLPVLIALRGLPIVTSEGDIVYKFDHLMSPRSTPNNNKAHNDVDNSNDESLFRKATQGIFSALMGKVSSKVNQWVEETIPNNTILNFGRRRNNHSGKHTERRHHIIDLPEPIKESEIPFSNAPLNSQLLSAVLGLTHLVGIIVVGCKLMLSSIGSSLVKPLTMFNYSLLVAYSLAINLYPFFRNQVRLRQNERILHRNSQREEWFEWVDQIYQDMLSRVDEISSSSSLPSSAADVDDGQDILSKIIHRKLRGAAEVRDGHYETVYHHLHHHHEESNNAHNADLLHGGDENIIYSSLEGDQHDNQEKHMRENLRAFDAKIQRGGA
jgi:hypothetical protein